MVNDPAVVGWTYDLPYMMEVRNLMSQDCIVEATLDVDLALAYVQKLGASIVIANLDLSSAGAIQIQTLEWLRKRLRADVRMIVLCGIEISPEDYAALDTLADILLIRPYPPSALVSAIATVKQ